MATPKIVVMGVSGCGKSTVGRLLARALDVPFVEGDELHPARNIELMASGVALTDDDRQGWLQSVGAQLSSPSAQSRGAIVTCSALRRSYRDLLRTHAPDLRFVFLQGDKRVLTQRMAERDGHYMPASLLQSQLDTLEPPAADERAIALDIQHPPEVLARQALHSLKNG